MAPTAPVPVPWPFDHFVTLLGPLCQDFSVPESDDLATSNERFNTLENPIRAFFKTGSVPS